jgi:hypothetical protein
MRNARKIMGSEMMQSKANGIDAVRSYRMMKSARLHAKGFTLIASLLMLLLLSGLAIGLLMMVNTEGKVGGTDLQNNLAFHAADGGIEKLASDLSATFTNAQSPHTSAICGVGGPPYGSVSNEPAMVGVTWTQYSVIPASGCTIDPPSHTWGQILSGPNTGLWAQIIPINMLATAALPGGQEVSMTRGAQVALIPVFQFGVFCEGDCGFFDSPNLTFAGRVHTNSDLYLGVASGATLTFNNKLEAFGNVVTEVLPNGLSAASFSDTGNVYIPTAVGGCSSPTSNCVLKNTNGDSTYGQGSVTGAGSSAAQSGSSYNGTNWNPFSHTTNSMIINGNYGSTTTPGTGAKKLSMPFVNGTTFPYQIIRRPLSSDSTALSESREYNLAQIHVLLSDDPADLPGGASDVNNIRLANVTANSSGAGASYPYGIATSVGTTTGTATLPAPSGGNAYTTYFATATNAIPSGTCTGTYTSTATPTVSINCLPDWPYPPAPWSNADMTAVAAGSDASGCVLLCPSSQTNAWAPTNTSGVVAAPFLSYRVSSTVGGMAGSSTLNTTGSNLGTYLGNSPNLMPTFLPCPQYETATNKVGNCPLTTAATWATPYYLVNSPPPTGTTTFANPVATATSSAVGSATWNLIDGWLRVEYLNSSGTWVPVTTEWLGLGFARDVIPPTSPGPSTNVGSNPINPNAILLLQEPADRYTQLNTTYPTTAITSSTHTGFSTTASPACPTTSGSGATKYCTSWSVANPQVLVDSTSNSWLFGLSSTTSPSTPTASTEALQSVTRFNWYPINFYDAREGEPRDIVWSNTYANDNSCTANGIMNAVEIDVGNLNRWLNGSIGTSGASVNSVPQNGYVLYYSDRRGMLPNPTLYGATFTKSGDSGLEDVVNSASAAGTPDGVLEPVPAGRTLSPEDVNQDGLLDNFGGHNLGLGFYGTGTSPITEPVTTTCSNANMPCVLAVTANPTPGVNIWYQVTNNDAKPNPDPYGTSAYNSRITSCSTARKNWVSGARHVLKLVDGSLGNVPNSPTGTSSDPGGFTVASENPVYIQGDYNSNSGDNFWPNGVQTGVADLAGHSSAAIIADAVTVLSDAWVDQYSTMGNNGNGGNYSPTVAAGNRTATSTYYRVAIAGGKNMAFPFPSWETNTDYGFGTDGGVHNFLRFLEDWQSGPATLNYGGSMVSLYYATYNTGLFKCCAYSVYQPPIRNYVFDSDFTLPSGLPPGTPMFRDVESLSYRQLFTTRQTGQ